MLLFDISPALSKPWSLRSRQVLHFLNFFKKKSQSAIRWEWGSDLGLSGQEAAAIFFRGKIGSTFCSRRFHLNLSKRFTSTLVISNGQILGILKVSFLFCQMERPKTWKGNKRILKLLPFKKNPFFISSQELPYDMYSKYFHIQFQFTSYIGYFEQIQRSSDGKKGNTMWNWTRMGFVNANVSKMHPNCRRC